MIWYEDNDDVSQLIGLWKTYDKADGEMKRRVECKAEDVLADIYEGIFPSKMVWYEFDGSEYDDLTGEKLYTGYEADVEYEHDPFEVLEAHGMNPDNISQVDEDDFWEALDSFMYDNIRFDGGDRGMFDLGDYDRLNDQYIDLTKKKMWESHSGHGRMRENYYDPNYYGTEHYYRVSPMGDLVVTDSVKDFCEEHEAYWLLDLVNSYYLTKLRRSKDFYLCICDVKNDRALFTIKEDTDSKPIVTKRIGFTDLDVSVKFYLDNGVLMFPSDY